MIKQLLEKYLGSLVRHGLTTLAGALIALGVIQGDGASFVATNYEVIFGLVMYVLGQGLSFVDKKKS